jgi:hypothetical protein
LKGIIVLLLLVSACKQDSSLDNIEIKKKPTSYHDSFDTGYIADEDAGYQESDFVDQRIGAITNNFSTFPSSDNFNQFLDSTLSSPLPGCSNYTDQTEEVTHVPTLAERNPAARGARFLLATLYQSCDVIDMPITPKSSRIRGVTKYKGPLGKVRKITNKSLYIKTHPILSKLNRDKNYPAKGCYDARKAPPIYGYGSRALPNRKGFIDLTRRGAGVSKSSGRASGIDCSSFISVALASQGLKLTKGGGNFQSATTTGFHHLLGRKNSCLKPAVFTAENSIRAGDIINVKGSHIIMIESVGKDPLGIERALKRGSCNSINIKRDFNFNYIHSGTTNNSSGPAIVSAKRMGNRTIFNNLRLAAVKMCKAKQRGKSKVSTKRMGLSKKFSISRHLSHNPKCIAKRKIKLKGAECAKQCKNI